MLPDGKVAEIRRLQKQPGTVAFVWDGTNDAGQPVASGVYLYHLQASDFQQVRKMLREEKMKGGVCTKPAG